MSATRRRSSRSGTAAPRAGAIVEASGLIAASSPPHQAAMLGAAVEETSERRVEFRLVEQEGVMPFVGRDLDEAHIGGGGVEGVDDLAVLRGRIKPVAGERD